MEPPVPLDELVDEITSWPEGMPVRAMEMVLASGAAAVPALAEALVRWQDDEDRALLWPIVLLGEVRDAAAIDPLIRQLRRTDEAFLAEAAAASLAKIGGDAVPALAELIRTGTAAERLFGYGALGWIRDPRAGAELLDALERDPELADVAATALVYHDDPQAIPAIYEAYRRCPPEHRGAFEAALRDLEHGEGDEPLWTGDWRVRYRARLEDDGMIEPEWLSVAVVVREMREVDAQPPLPLRTLEEILADPPPPEEPPETCEECGAALEEPTGVPACPESAVAVIATQIGLLEAAVRLGEDQVFELWDRLDHDYWALVDDGEPRLRKARERWHDDLDTLDLGSRTCRWLVEQGVESLHQAVAMLRALAVETADQYGDPEGLLAPAAPVRQEKVGRNEPCPCGSGRKYKRCCMDRP